MKKFFTILLLFCGTILKADCCDDRGYFQFSGEWLYFIPSFDQSEYIVKGGVGSDSTGLTERLGVDQSFASGYRLEGVYLLCNRQNAFAFRYTQFHDVPKSSVGSSANDLLPIIGIPGLISNQGASGNALFQRDYNYYSIEGLYRLCCLEACCTQTKLLIGVEYNHLHIKEEGRFPGQTNFVVDNDMQAFQLGPEFALEACWDFSDCLSLLGRAQGSIFSTWNRSKLTSSSQNAVLLIKNKPNFWHVTPAWGARLGLSADHLITLPRCWGACGFHIEAGYEWYLAMDAVDRIYFVDSSASGFSLNEWSNFTLQGPYVRINLSF